MPLASALAPFSCGGGAGCARLRVDPRPVRGCQAATLFSSILARSEAAFADAMAHPARVDRTSCVLF